MLGTTNFPGLVNFSPITELYIGYSVNGQKIQEGAALHFVQKHKDFMGKNDCFHGNRIEDF